METQQQAALALAAQGIPSFPCSLNKVPTCKGGFHAATTDPAALKALWQTNPGQLIGVATGRRTGFDVLDVDPRHGGLTWWNANAHRMPRTRTHETRSSGFHAFFKHRDGARNTASLIAPGVDTRADGGFVIWWPAQGHAVDEAPIADWPDWLWAEYQRAIAPKVVSYPAAVPLPANKVASSARAHQLVERSLSRVRQAPNGQKHYRLVSAARTIGGVLDAAEISEHAAVAHLLDAVKAAGAVDMRNAEKTARWGISEGKRQPLALGASQ